jgi:hypothetical protein
MINNNIEESYCSFEIAKLLKEKGFEAMTNSYYDKYGIQYLNNNNYNWNIKYSYETNQYSNPTQNIAIEWIRTNFNIWIEIRFGKDHNQVWFDYDIYSLIKPRKDDLLSDDENEEYIDDPNEKFLDYNTTYNSLIDEKFELMEKKNYDSPEKAKNAALLYTLKNLL